MVITGDDQMQTPGPVMDPGEVLSGEAIHSWRRKKSLSGNEQLIH